MDAESDPVDDREDNIRRLIESIRSKRSRVSKQPPMAVPQRETRSKTKGRSTYKLHIGWQHFDEGKRIYKQVKAKLSGGVRSVQYQIDHPMDIPQLIELGKKLFFPEGKNERYGKVEEMEVHLANYSGEKISTFTDIDGNVCSLQQYLKSFGLFSSHYHIYLMTKRKETMAIETIDPTTYTAGLCMLECTAAGVSTSTTETASTTVPTVMQACHN